MIGDWLIAMHVLGAGLWVGGSALVLLVLRRSQLVSAPPGRIAGSMGWIRRYFLLAGNAMPIVILTGYGLLFGVYGGFAGVGWNVHVMHLFGLIMGALLIWTFFGPWSALRGGDARAVTVIRGMVLVNLVFGVSTVIAAALP